MGGSAKEEKTRTFLFNSSRSLSSPLSFPRSFSSSPSSPQANSRRTTSNPRPFSSTSRKNYNSSLRIVPRFRTPPRHSTTMPAIAAPSSSSSRVLTFSSHQHLRHRLILSLLSRRPIRIDKIRPSAESPGLAPFEISFLRLLEKMTEGTRVEISYTGTSLLFHPGTISGGTFTHVCPVERSVGWFLEPILAIAPFGKKGLSLTLKGITTDGRDASVDTLRTSGLPHLAMFLEQDGLELKVRLFVSLRGEGLMNGRRLRNAVIHHLVVGKSLSPVPPFERSRVDSISRMSAPSTRFVVSRRSPLSLRVIID